MKTKSEGTHKNDNYFGCCLLSVFKIGFTKVE